MAKKINEDGMFAFDQDHVDSGSIETKGTMDYIAAFFTSRYAILGIIICLFGLVILIMTTALQLSGASEEASTTSSSGVSRQYTVSAPRGDIVDCNGVVLASSEEVQTLLIANAGMDDADLNAMLLDLSYLFDHYNCVPVEELSDYLTIDPYAFAKDAEDISSWQMSSDLFALDEAPANSLVTYSDEYVKSDPQVFFLYLRDLFGIDPTYSPQDAYRIMLLRYQIFADSWAFTTGTPVEIATDVPDELINYLLEQNYKYEGLLAGTDYRRTYSPLAETSCHVVGYIGQISQETYATLSDFGYSLEDVVGQSGVEYQMERYLHGQTGEKAYNIWTEDGSDGTFYSEEIGTDPIPGATVKLTIDSTYQTVVLDAIKQYIADAKAQEEAVPTGLQTASAGAVIMLDVNTGAVLTMVSFPNYDPNDFVLSMEGDEDAEAMLEYYLDNDPDSQTAKDMPLWNRAILSQYAPGSTFKMVTAVAGLENGIITASSNTIECVSPWDCYGWTFWCHERREGGHGPLTLTQAFATSCNIYFMRLGVETGINAIDEWGEKLGLGELSGIDLPGETVGVRASRETKRLVQEEEYDKTWFPADTAQSSIGQYDNKFTILQLARYTAALATNYLVTPHVIESVTAEDGTILYEGSTERTYVGISDTTLQVIKQGMIAVAGSEIGTAYESLGDFPVEIACKTGTAETGLEYTLKQYSNGLFVCYAPADDPQIAIALVVEKGEWGASTTVIAEKLMYAYFKIADPSLPEAQVGDAEIGDYTTAETPITSPTPTPAT